MSSKETAFSMDLLKRLDAEIVIGQLSYKQRADIYNHVLNSNSDDQFYHKYVVLSIHCSIPVIMLNYLVYVYMYIHAACLLRLEPTPPSGQKKT